MMSSENIPVYVSKFFRMSATARSNLSPISAADGRVCQLDTQNTNRVLVVAANSSSSNNNSLEWDEMHWSQKSLFEEAERDCTLRISRKKIAGMTTVHVLQRDLFNEPELSLRADGPDMEELLASAVLGHFQAEKHEYVYILSKKDVEEGKPSQQQGEGLDLLQ